MMKSDKPRAYFGHSSQSFNTEAEKRILKVLREKYRVICPNENIGRLVTFDNYLNIVAWADLVVIWEYQGFVTRGVFNESIHALKLGIPVFVVRESPTGYLFAKVERVDYYQGRVNQDQYGKLILQANDSIV